MCKINAFITIAEFGLYGFDFVDFCSFVVVLVVLVLVFADTKRQACIWIKR